MKFRNHVLVSATRVLAAAVVLTGAMAAQADSILSLKGTTMQAKYPSDDSIRMSLLAWNDKDATADFIKNYQQYMDNHNNEAFLKYIKGRQTLGYIFSKEATGYTIKYAWKDPANGNHMVFAVTPGLTTLNPYMWKSKNDKQPDFSIIEVKYDGDDAVFKTSLDSPVEISGDGTVLTLKDYNKASRFAVMEDNTPYYLKEKS